MVDIRMLLPNGVRVRDRKKAPVTSRSAAERWGEDRVRAILLQGGVEPKEAKTSDVPTLGEFYVRFKDEYVKAEGLKASTVEGYESSWRAWLSRFADKRLDEIRTSDVQALKAAIQDKGRSKKTIANTLTALSSILSFAVDIEVLKAMPCKVKLPKIRKPEMKFHSDAQLDALVTAAARLSKEDELLVLLGADAGLRAGEIRALEWGDIDFVRNEITVRRAAWRHVVSTPKHGKVRSVPMTPRLRAALTGKRDLQARVIPGPRKDLVSHTWVSGRLEAIERLAGVVVTGGLHKLRHTFGTRCAMAGVPVRTIMEWMGHGSLSVVERYMHYAPAAGAAAIALLERRTA